MSHLNLVMHGQFLSHVYASVLSVLDAKRAVQIRSYCTVRFDSCFRCN